MLAISDELRKQGVGGYTSAPPIYRAAWLLGLRMRPPLYQSFTRLAVDGGVWFAVAWGTAMWLWVGRPEGRSPGASLLTALFAGLLFGVSNAGFYRWKAARLQLPLL